MSQDQVLCNECGFVLSNLPDLNSVSGCPACGSHDRQINVSDAFRFYEQVRIKQKTGKRIGKHKINREVIVGDDFHVASGKWNVVTQIIDRDEVVDGETGTYFKEIIDGETGQGLEHREGSLSKHQGYGDAKRRKAKPR